MSFMTLFKETVWVDVSLKGCCASWNREAPADASSFMSSWYSKWFTTPLNDRCNLDDGSGWTSSAFRASARTVNYSLFQVFLCPLNPWWILGTFSRVLNNPCTFLSHRSQFSEMFGGIPWILSRWGCGMLGQFRVMPWILRRGGCGMFGEFGDLAVR